MVSDGPVFFQLTKMFQNTWSISLINLIFDTVMLSIDSTISSKSEFLRWHLQNSTEGQGTGFDTNRYKPELERDLLK